VPNANGGVPTLLPVVVLAWVLSCAAPKPGAAV
jgi:hypothetical protein